MVQNNADTAEKLLEICHELIDQKEIMRARVLLQSLIDLYPEERAAVTAKRLLKNLKKTSG